MWRLWGSHLKLQLTDWWKTLIGDVGLKSHGDDHTHLLWKLVIPAPVKRDSSRNKTFAVNIWSLAKCCKILWQNTRPTHLESAVIYGVQNYGMYLCALQDKSMPVQLTLDRNCGVNFNNFQKSAPESSNASKFLLCRAELCVCEHEGHFEHPL